MEVAITGAGGYLGSALVRKHLERGDAVRALLRASTRGTPDPRIRVFRGDLAHPEAVPIEFLEGADVLYHCAAELSREGLMHAVNVRATRTLAERARGRIGRWVQVSTVAVYGRPRQCVITEESPLQPSSLYARTKAEAECVVAEASRGEFSYAILRPSGIFGPSMKSASLYQLISALDRRLFVFMGEPGAIINCIHEANVVHALLLCATRPEARERCYNLSDDRPIEHVVAILCRELGKPAPRLRLPESVAKVLTVLSRRVPSFPLTEASLDVLTRRIHYSTSRIENELGYRSVKPLEEGLGELVSEWRARTR